MTAIILVMAWLCGVVVADLWQLPFGPLVSGGIGCAALALALRRWPRLRLVVLVCACAALGGARLAAAAVPTTPQSVWLLNERGSITLQGVVVEDPRRDGMDQRVVLAAERVAVDGRVRAVTGLVLLKLPAYPVRRYGDRLLLTIELKTPREATRPGQFDYRQYLMRKAIFSLGEPKAVRLVATGHGNPAWAALLGLRDTARQVLLRELPEPQASLAIGILLGLQSSIPVERGNKVEKSATLASSS